MAISIRSPRCYSGKHLRYICRALGLPTSIQNALRRHLDTAAKFYRLGEYGLSAIPADDVLDQLQSLQNSVRKIRILFTGPSTRSDQEKLKRARAKLLRILGGESASWDDLLDGGYRPLLRDALCVGADTNAREAELTEIIGTLLAGSDADAICAAADRLDQRAAEGMLAIRRVRSLTVRPGHSGDRRFTSWLDSMLAAYDDLTGRPIATSVDPTDGTPGGPLIRFLKLAGWPLDIRKTDKAWRECIRRSPAYQAPRPAQKKF